MAHFMRGQSARLPSLQLGPQGFAGTAVRIGVPFAILWTRLTALMEQASFAEVLLPRGLVGASYLVLSRASS
jgi:hypothetical protein